MEIFDKRFVHFMWNPALKGKRGFLSSGIDTLIKMVNEDSDRTEIQKGCERDLPFCKHITVECRLAYYDPNYSVKWAYYKEGKKIQVTPKGTDKWVDLHCEPKWDLRDEYRVKPECPCEDGIDSKACVGCEHSEDGKREYKPYVTVDEFIQDFQERFPTAVPRPAHTMPLIWIAHKTDGTTRLIVEFSDRSVKIGCKVKPVDFGKLFEYWTYTDGSPVGMEVKE